MSWIDELRRSGVVFKTRAQWGARYQFSNRRMGKPRHAFLHLTVTNPTGRKNYDSRFVERIGIIRFPNTGMSYTALVHRGGEIHQGQPDGRAGAHTLNDKKVAGFPHNLNLVGDAIAYVGNVQHPFTEVEADAVARYFAARQRAGIANYDKIHMHNEFAWKECPGENAAKWIDWINKKFKEYVKNGLPGAQPPRKEEWDEMATKKEVKEAGKEGMIEALASDRGQGLIANGMAKALRDGPVVRREFIELVEETLRTEAGQKLIGNAVAASFRDGRVTRREVIELVQLAMGAGKADTAEKLQYVADHLPEEEV